MSRVSVVIPCYNASPFLRETLESALTQTHSPLEVIVVDDGSTDDSAAIAESYGEPVRVIRQENQGESVARNVGIEACHGEWVAFLDADDAWAPQKIEHQLALLAPEVVAVHTNAEITGCCISLWDYGKQSDAIRYSLPNVVREMPFLISSMLVRKSASPRFATWTRYGEDMLYCLDLVRVGNIKLVREPLTYYRRHGNNQSSDTSAPIGWHKSLVQWLELNAGNISAEEAESIYIAQLSKLVRSAEKFRWQRNWKAFDQTIRYLRACRGDCRQVRRLIRSARIPRIAYQVKDSLWRK